MSQASGNELPKFPSGTFLAGRALYATQYPLEGLRVGLARDGAERLLLLAGPQYPAHPLLYSFHLLELNMEGSSRHLQCKYEGEICRMMLRLICVIVFLPTMTAAAEYPSEVGQLIDLLVPGPDNPQLKRACMLQLDGDNVPCDAVWYVGFKDGAESIQFNRGSGRNPIVSFFGKHRDMEIISIDGIAMKIGQQPAQARASGDCIVSKTKNAIGCLARIDDGRLVIGTIFVDTR